MYFHWWTPPVPQHAHYVANMENMANMENWMRVFAANHAAGNWDSFGATTHRTSTATSAPQGTK